MAANSAVLMDGDTVSRMDISSAMFLTEYCCNSLSNAGSIIPLSDICVGGKTNGASVVEETVI
jgi:hypothetical protein